MLHAIHLIGNAEPNVQVVVVDLGIAAEEVPVAQDFPDAQQLRGLIPVLQRSAGVFRAGRRCFANDEDASRTA